MKRLTDLDRKEDKVVYELKFYIEEDDGLYLYETLNLDSDPMLPDQGEYISFNFLQDSEGNEVFREDGYIDGQDIGSDEEYDHLLSPSYEIKRIDTTYEKHLTEQDKNTTTVKKSIVLKRELL